MSRYPYTLVALVATVTNCNASVSAAGRGPGAPLAVPVVTNPPRWGWGSLGAMSFLHAGDPHPYTTGDRKLLGRFPMVQFDKLQGLNDAPNASTEDRIIAAAREVKDVNPHATILMYINGLIDFSASRLRSVTSADPSLLVHNSTGGRVTVVRDNGAYDMRNPKMRKAFVDDALHGMASGVINGVFIDRANWCESCSAGRGGWDAPTCESMVPAQRELLSDLTLALGEGNLTLAKEHSGTSMADWQLVNAAMTSDAFCSSYCRADNCSEATDPASTWGKLAWTTCAHSIATIANMSARGQLSQSHAMGPVGGPHAAKQREFTMAAFLIGAGNLSYFSYANWLNNSWTMQGTSWWPEYDRELGAPTSPPNTKVPGKRWKYVRNFSSGTSVYVDVATRVVHIKWAAAVHVGDHNRYGSGGEGARYV